MSLKASYPNETEIPEALKPHYKQEGTAWVLDADGMVPESKLIEYRNTNIDVLRDRDQVIKPKLAAFEDIGTAEDFKHLKDIRDQLDEGKLVRSGKLDEAVAKRVEAMKEDYEKKLRKAEEKTAEIKARFAVEKIDKEIMAAATKLGAKPTALEDIVARLRNRIKLDDDGKVITFMPDGVTRYYGKSGNEAATSEELVLELQPNTPHLFEENAGLHSEPGKRQAAPPRTGAFQGPNPWKRESHNLTLRMKIAKENPELAKRLRAEAGIAEVGATA
jgi:hypothetical protein